MILHQARLLFSGAGRHTGTKLACHAAVGAWIALFYYGPQLWPLFPAHPAPTLAVDRWIPFQPAWALAYQSVFLVHTLALWLPQDPAAVKGYAYRVALVFAGGAVVFWLYPTLSPRPEPSASFFSRWFISAVDGPRNAFPSLHAALGLLAVVAVCEHFRACRVALWWRAGLVLWWIVLLYSTLATRQHRLLDLLAGIVLGRGSFLLKPSTNKTRSHHDRHPVLPHQSPIHERDRRADPHARR